MGFSAYVRFASKNTGLSREDFRYSDMDIEAYLLAHARRVVSTFMWDPVTDHGFSFKSATSKRSNLMCFDFLYLTIIV
jgi:hypothetical protein